MCVFEILTSIHPVTNKHLKLPQIYSLAISALAPPLTHAPRTAHTHHSNDTRPTAHTHARAHAHAHTQTKTHALTYALEHTRQRLHASSFRPRHLEWRSRKRFV